MADRGRAGGGAESAEAVETLRAAFEQFQRRAEKLSNAYESMREDFRKVNLELDRKNEALAESLRKEEETQTFLGSILQSMNNGVIGIDVMGTMTLFNKAAEETTGFAEDEVKGKSYAELFQRGVQPHMSLLHTLRTGRELKREEKVIWHKQQHPIPVSFQTALLRDPSGRLLGAVEIFSDISRLKELEEEMQQTRAMAALGEMSATVAHEIRNPLGAMGIWAGVLQRDLDADDPRKKTLDRIVEGLSRLNRIVSSLLVYCRPVKAQVRDVNLHEVLSEIVNFVEIEIERLGRDVIVQRRWDGDRSILVRADPEKLHQVVMNLCFNALQAMPEGGTLGVSIDPPRETTGGYLSFSIEDNGEGIPEEVLAKIFDPFFTTKTNGTGLGLPIVKKLLEYQSAHIDINSVPGQGTVARVFVPGAR